MFNNIGGKIKFIAQAWTVLGIIIFCVLGVTILKHSIAIGLIIICLGCLCSWLSSLLLYGLGQLIENSDIITDILIESTKQSYTESQQSEENNNNNYNSDFF